MTHKTQILIKNNKPTSPHTLTYDDEGNVTGIQSVHVQQGGLYATMRHVPSATAAVSTHDKPIPEILTETDWQPLDLSIDLPLPDAYHRAHSPIFRYAFVYPDALRSLVHAFCATASDAWSRARAKGEVPAGWQITPFSEGAEMLVLDATIGQASQYGSAEQLARRTAEFGEVNVVQWLNPDIDWGGMALTNPSTDEKEQYAPGEARITTLENIGQHEQVTAEDIPARAGYTSVTGPD